MKVPLPLSVTEPWVPVMSMLVTERVSLVSGSSSLVRTSPVVKLFAAGELQQDLFDLLLLNVRLPRERRGDWFAQVAACRTGARRLQEIVARYGVDPVQAVFEEIISRSRARMRERIALIPDGEYSFHDVMDDDGLGSVDILIDVRITVSGDRIAFDFSGTAPQVRGNINVQDARTEGLLSAYEQSVLLALEEVEGAMTAYAKEQVRRDAPTAGETLDVTASAFRRPARTPGGRSARRAPGRG